MPSRLTNSQQDIFPPPSFPFTSHPADFYSDPLDDVLRSLTATYTTEPLPQQHQYPPPLENEFDLSDMSPHQQLDPATAMAWLQLLQSQVPPQHDPGLGSSSSKVQPNVQDNPDRPPTQPAHTPNEPANPEEEEDSEGERTATAEDKRRRNTAASGNLPVALALCDDS